MDILDPGDYGAVRSPLGMPESLVPDSLIEELNYLPFVEGEVKLVVTDWSTVLAGNDQNTIRLKLGVAYWVAARLCEYVDRGESQDYRLGTYTQKPTSVNWQKKAQELAQESAKNLGSLATRAAVSRMDFMTVDGPTRSQTRKPAEFSEWLDKIEPTVIDWLQDEDL